MLLPSIARCIGICPRTLVEHTRGSSASLRHFRARVVLAKHPLERHASEFQLTTSHSSYTHAHSKPHPPYTRKIYLRSMSDDAYSSFLDQANQDTGTSKASTTSKSTATKAVDSDVPITLQEVDQYYTSEADEPFEPVSLKWSGKNMPSESMKSRTKGTFFGPQKCEYTLMKDF